MRSVLELKFLKNIENDTIIRSDLVKLNVLKVEPINFNLKTKTEQKNILESYRFLLKQCDFNFQIYIQTQKVNIEKHIKEIKKCVEFESEIEDMATDYINFINDIVDSKGNISRKFYIVYESKENNRRDLIIQECLKSCGNVVYKCEKNEILKLFNSCFKKQLSNLVALAN